VKPGHAQLPKGARIYLPDEAARKRHVEARLLDVFRRWGYREIVTPTFEYSDVLAMGTDVGVQENMFKFVDRETGRMLALRADITPQIARVVATRLRDEPKPVRLAYITNVFRYDEPQVSHYREFYQAGVELIGLDKPEAEVEVIAMAIEGLRALGLERFQLDLGHPDFFHGLLEEVRTDAAGRRAVREALARKDASTLERLVAALAPPAHVAEALLALPTLFGHEAVLERAAAHAKNERSARALANLSEVYRLLKIYGLAEAVLLDLGEVRGFDYYSGTYFEAYVAGFGASIAGGGRYDDMLGRFGYQCAAVGFAFDIARALAVMESQGIAVELPGPDFFIIDFTRDKTAALSLARRLRDLGASVARDIISRGLEESVAYARAQRVRWVLVAGSPRTGAEEVLALDLGSGGERTLALRQVLDAPERCFPDLPALIGAHAASLGRRPGLEDTRHA
jgi:ATP phosphoribosyltransferase regulatory subunit